MYYLENKLRQLGDPRAIRLAHDHPVPSNTSYRLAARDETRGDHAHSCPPTTHLTVEEEIPSAFVGKCTPVALSKLKKVCLAMEHVHLSATRGVGFMRYKGDPNHDGNTIVINRQY